MVAQVRKRFPVDAWESMTDEAQHCTRVVFLKVHVYVGAHFCYRGLDLEVNKIFY